MSTTQPTAGAERPQPRVQRTVRIEVTVDAPIEAVWVVLCDVTRIREWSHECRSAHWLGNATGAARGARFRAHHRVGWIRWARTNELIDVRPPVGLAWRTVPSVLYPDSTEWRFRLRPDGDGTTIVEDFRVVHLHGVLDRLYARAIPSHRDRTDALIAGLRRLGEVARRDAGSPPSATSPAFEARPT